MSERVIYLFLILLHVFSGMGLGATVMNTSMFPVYNQTTSISTTATVYNQTWPVPNSTTTTVYNQTTPRAVLAPAVYAHEVAEPSQGIAWTVWLVVPVAVAVLGICVALWVHALEKPGGTTSYTLPPLQRYRFKRHTFMQIAK